VDDIQKEITLLQQLMLGAGGGTGAMPNVIKYYGSLMEGPRVWIIMEFAEGGSIRTLVGGRCLCRALVGKWPCG
jgi:protein-serine/threonine kinase